MKAVLIPGDGIGREIAQSVRTISDVLDTGIQWQEFEAGAEYAAANGELIAPGTLDAIEDCGWALKGPTATPIGKGFRSINVQLRQRFHTYANLRPVRTLPGVATRFDQVDLVIVRENTEDLYKGIEYMLDEDTANGVKLITRCLKCAPRCSAPRWAGGSTCCPCRRRGVSAGRRSPSWWAAPR